MGSLNLNEYPPHCLTECKQNQNFTFALTAKVDIKAAKNAKAIKINVYQCQKCL